MKFIFDFDDVLFYNTKKLKEHMYSCLEKAGVSRNAAEQYYKKEGSEKFQLKKLLAYFSVSEDLYEDILLQSKNFINKELIDFVKKLGRENCYIVTHSENKEWQVDKIRNAGINSLFSEIFVVSDNKKGAIEKICARHINEKVVFVDDKAKHFADLDFRKYPNLKTVLFDEKGLEKVKAEIES